MYPQKEKGRKDRIAGWKMSTWSGETTSFSVVFSTETEIRTRQVVNLCISNAVF